MAKAQYDEEQFKNFGDFYAYKELQEILEAKRRADY